MSDCSPHRDRSAKRAPRWFALAAWSIPPGILAQFLLAGLSLFHDAAIWQWHMALGFLILIPTASVLAGALTSQSVRPLRWWAMALAALYGLQIVWIVAGQSTGSGILQGLHAFNAGLLLTAALVIVAKIERSHSG